MPTLVLMENGKYFPIWVFCVSDDGNPFGDVLRLSVAGWLSRVYSPGALVNNKDLNTVYRWLLA